jgi:predicted CoA-binding protein
MEREMDQAKQDFINCKRIAVVGISRSDAKFGNMTYKELKSRGYEVIPVHHEMETFDGDRCYKQVSDISPKVEGVFINVTPGRVLEILQDTAGAGVKKIWLQQGSESAAAIELGKVLGMSLATHGCILMYAEPVKSFHSFHRWVWKLAKKY